jgi:hypothetical protein
MSPEEFRAAVQRLGPTQREFGARFAENAKGKALMLNNNPRRCDECLRQLPPPSNQFRAKIQRFCSNVCRNRWHSARRAEGLKLLQQQENVAPGKETTL